MNSTTANTESLEAKLTRIAACWVGTPFMPRARLRGVGVDCIQLAAAILTEAGMLPEYDLPTRYDVDFGEHTDFSPIFEWFNSRAEWQKVNGPTQAGDICLFRIGRAVSHVGVALGCGRFVHCLRHHGVLISHLDDSTYARRLTAVFRFNPAALPCHV